MDCVILFQSRFHELTNLTVSIQNEIDAMTEPLKPKPTAATAIGSGSGGSGGGVVLSFRAIEQSQYNIRRRLRALHERMTAVQSSATVQDSSSDQQFVLDRLTKQLTVAEEYVFCASYLV